MRSRWVNLGAPVHYADYGGDGQAMVMLHGLGGSFIEWMLLAPLLTSHFRVLALDMWGFGRTEVNGRKSTIYNNQELTAAFIAEVAGSDATVVGHSMGGLVAMMLAARHPEVVSNLVLVDPAVPPVAESTPIIPRPILNVLLQSVTVGNTVGVLMGKVLGPERLVTDTVRRAVADVDAVNPKLMRAMVELERQRLEAGSPYVGYVHARNSIGSVIRDRGVFEREVVAPIAAPTLLIQGSSDPIISSEGIERLHRRRPDWVVEIIEGAGHNPNMEVPGRVAELMLRHLRALTAA
jgi:pimeloyl-ACP methyl ester carboxylesterase